MGEYTRCIHGCGKCRKGFLYFEVTADAPWSVKGGQNTVDCDVCKARHAILIERTGEATCKISTLYIGGRSAPT